LLFGVFGEKEKEYKWKWRGVKIKAKIITILLFPLIIKYLIIIKVINK